MILIEEVKMKGKEIGAVAAIGRGRVGYSICNPLDEYSLPWAMAIAVWRARVNRNVVAGLEKKRASLMKEYRLGTGQKAAQYRYRQERQDEIILILGRTNIVLNHLRAMIKRSKRMKW